MKTSHDKPQGKPRTARSAAKQGPAGLRSGAKPSAFAGGMRETDAPARQRRPAEPGIGNIERGGKNAGAFVSFADLGEGYAVVKLRPSRREGELYVQPALPRMKEPALLKVRNLLKKIAVQAPAAAAANDADSAAAQADNDVFTASLQADAMRARARLHEEGQLLASAQLCERLQVTRQSLSRAVAQQRLFALDGPGGRKLYPAFFGDAGLPRRELEQVAQSLGSLPGAVKWQFFTTPSHSLDGKTPVEGLSKGRLDDVLRAAAGFKERELGN